MEGFLECTVLKDNCRFYDGTRYLNTSKGDTIWLPEYQANLEADAGFVTFVTPEPDPEIDIVTHGLLSKQVVYNEVLQVASQLSLMELRRIRQHLETMTGEEISEEEG